MYKPDVRCRPVEGLTVIKEFPIWYYDEMKQTGVDFSRLSQVEAYDRQMSGLRNIETEAGRILDVLNLPGDARIMEIGSGTGSFAIQAGRFFNQVLALDVSQAMIDYARIKAEKQGMDNIQFMQAGFLSCQIPDETLDAIVTQIALHHLPDFWKLVALKRMHRMLKKGGKLYLRDIVFSFPIDQYQEFFPRFIEDNGRLAGEAMAHQTAISIRDEYYTLDWIMEGLLKQAGFQLVTKEYALGFMAVYLCCKQ